MIYGEINMCQDKLGLAMAVVGPWYVYFILIIFVVNNEYNYFSAIITHFV